jgi:hypothetical protein
VRYEPPRIIRRERIVSVLQTLSNVDTGNVSDVNRKENIVAVVW